MVQILARTGYSVWSSFSVSSSTLWNNPWTKWAMTYFVSHSLPSPFYHPVTIFSQAAVFWILSQLSSTYPVILENCINNSTACGKDCIKFYVFEKPLITYNQSVQDKPSGYKQFLITTVLQNKGMIRYKHLTRNFLTHLFHKHEHLLYLGL